MDYNLLEMSIQRKKMNAFSYGFKKFWKKRMPLALVGYICSAIALVCDLLIPFLGADIINYFFEGINIDTGNLFFFLFSNAASETTLETFSHIAIAMGALVLTRLIFLYIKNISFQWNGLDMENEMRRITYNKLMKLDGETLSAYNTGELLTIMNRDVIMSKEMYCRGMLNYYDSAIALAVSSAFLISINPWLMLIPLLLAPPFIVSLVKYVKSIHKVFVDMRQAYSELNLAVQENIRAVRIVRAFSNEETEREKFKKANYKLRDAMIAVDKTSAKYNSLFEFYKQISYAVTVAICALLILSGNMLLGSLSAATAYVLKIMNHISQISQNTGSMQRQYVAMDRLRKFMETEGKISDYASAHRFYSRPHITVENLSLVLDEKQVLKNVNLDIPYGKKLGVMGGTGSGKSVLLKSLSRIYDATGGSINIDGENVKDMNPEELRDEYAYVFQDVFLFSHTIDANIAFYDVDAPMSDVEESARIAQAENFIQSLGDKYETIVGERGLGISGGQKQRISIARALMKNAPVLILDDASSSLDMATEKKVLEGIKKKYPDRTLIIAAHRISSVADCDEIIYIQDGEITERGTLDELISLGGRVAAIYNLQTSDGQLDDSSYGESEIEKEGGEI